MRVEIARLDNNAGRFAHQYAAEGLILDDDRVGLAEYVTAETYLTLETAELGEEDMALSIFDGEFIDIDGIVREELLLAVPTHSICQESCKGFCSVCGADRNVTDCNCDAQEIDPRWSGLKDLRF